jgi:hypothetical protein
MLPSDFAVALPSFAMYKYPLAESNASLLEDEPRMIFVEWNVAALALLEEELVGAELAHADVLELVELEEDDVSVEDDEDEVEVEA